MSYGLLTEYISVPKFYADTTTYQYPIGRLQVDAFREGEPYNGITNLRSLPIVSESEWELDEPLTYLDLGIQRTRKRAKNFVRRMIPHALGYVPLIGAWVIIIVYLEWARHDLKLITDAEIPEWVYRALYGTIIIFVSFAFVQLLYQWLNPGFYWGLNSTLNTHHTHARNSTFLHAAQVPSSSTARSH